MNDTFKIGLYFNKNYWNGFQSKPVVFAISNDRLVVKTTKTTLIDAPLTDLSVFLSSWGSLHVKVKGKDYRFTTFGARVSDNFSKEQSEELRSANMASAYRNVSTGAMGAGAGLAAAGRATGSTAVGVAGMAGEAIGVASELMTYNSLKGEMDQICQLFKNLGVPVRQKKQRLGLNVFLTVVAAFVAIIVIIGIVGAVRGN